MPTFYLKGRCYIIPNIHWEKDEHFVEESKHCLKLSIFSFITINTQRKVRHIKITAR